MNLCNRVIGTSLHHCFEFTISHQRLTFQSTGRTNATQVFIVIAVALRVLTPQQERKHLIIANDHYNGLIVTDHVWGD